MFNLHLPSRPAKPRTHGRTQILDKGLGLGAIRDIVETAGHTIDLVKLGWGTATVTANLEKKLQLYADHDIEICLGGTLFELAVHQGQVDQYREWLHKLGIASVEVSDGTITMADGEKTALIASLAEEFTVYSEVGSKDSSVVVTPARWVEAIRRELEAGSSMVILEGRESGTAGLYRESGEIRMGLVDEIIEAGIPQDSLVFEAPNKRNQVWLIRHLGPTVNLANIRAEDAISVETLRLGLRADTLLDIHPGQKE